MIRSMTAFAAVERATPWGVLAAELRAVNHRYLELALRLPEELRALEPALRERVAARVQRGKLDLQLRLRGPEADGELRVNAGLLDRLAQVASECRLRFPDLKVGLADLLAFPGLLEQARIDPQALQSEALALADSLLDDFSAGREREGERLAALMSERLDAIAELAGRVRGWLPDIRAAQRQRFEQRLAEWRQTLDAGRIEQELVLALQKLDVDEELDRLAVHVAEARNVLGRRDAVGRRLDFLMQEFNREANTLGSKSVDARTTQVAVDLKVLIEQLREQVQNIE